MAAMFYAFVFDVTRGFNSIDQLCDKLHHFQFVSKDEPVDDIYGHKHRAWFRKFITYRDNIIGGDPYSKKIVSKKKCNSN